MAEYLVFRLYGPLASWGEIAVGESRQSAVHPTRSALLGLIGAALGVEREDDERQARLATGYRFGIKVVSLGTPLRDYHTVQAPSQQRKVSFHTRRQELVGAGKLNTLLSSRVYRCDSISLVAVQTVEGAPYTVPELSAALRHPVFPLYLGRRSCPLALPVHPQVVMCQTVREALDMTAQSTLMGLLSGREPDSWPSAADKRVFNLTAPRYYWDSGMDAGMVASFETVRNDQIGRAHV